MKCAVFIGYFTAVIPNSLDSKALRCPKQHSKASKDISGTPAVKTKLLVFNLFYLQKP